MELLEFYRTNDCGSVSDNIVGANGKKIIIKIDDDTYRKYSVRIMKLIGDDWVNIAEYSKPQYREPFFEIRGVKAGEIIKVRATIWLGACYYDYLDDETNYLDNVISELSNIGMDDSALVSACIDSLIAKKNDEEVFVAQGASKRFISVASCPTNIKPSQPLSCVFSASGFTSADVPYLRIASPTYVDPSRVTITTTSNSVTVTISAMTPGTFKFFVYDYRDNLIRSETVSVDVSANTTITPMYKAGMVRDNGEYVTITAWALGAYPNKFTTSWDCGGTKTDRVFKIGNLYYLRSETIALKEDLEGMDEVNLTIKHNQSVANRVAVDVSNLIF